MTEIIKRLKIALLIKVTASLVIFITVFCIACNHEQKAALIPEPADPDTYDISVWKNVGPGIHSSFGSVDIAYSKNIPPQGHIAESIVLQGWRGERVHCLLLVWSAESEESIRLEARGLRSGHYEIAKESTSISVIKYVLSDEFSGGCGPRDKDKNPVHLSPDLLSKANSFTIDTPGTRPVWISVDIPSETPAGIYKGTISRTSTSGTINHVMTLEVLNKSLPDPSEWSFHLDLWQNPYAVARFHRVEPWSREHISLLRPLLTMLAQAGQKCITTTLIDDPWAGQTFDHYGSMINWIKKSDGTWAYDYSVFDQYVSLAMETGIKEQINCYSMVPVGNIFSWFDEKSAKSITVEAIPGTAEYENIWRNFLDTKTLDNRSAADAVNEGKQVLYDTVKSVYHDQPDRAAPFSKVQGLKLLGNRFFTFSTVVRVRQIETSRAEAQGPDESSLHTPEEARTFREAIEKGWPGAQITWAFSWLALKDQRPNYLDLKKRVVSYHKKYGDEITFIPGGYFANMYNTREQVNRDLHEGLQMVSQMVGGGYRPQSVIAGFLSAENLRFLAEEEGIHVCQGNIWSQYAVDNGDGEGSISYPYYPSREHFCKPAQGKEDLIDCVNLDGWTVDFLNARFPGARMINGVRCGSRQGVGPIETLLRQGTSLGTKEMLATTAAHFDTGFALNNFAWVTCIWELCLVEGRKIYGYNGRNGLDGLMIWLSEMRRRWPEARCITQGEFGMLWREQFKNNDNLNYRFVQRGSGVCGSEPEMEIRWFMNKAFRLALLRDWKANTPEKLIDFTRYDLTAQEPDDPNPGQFTRNWSLLNRLNQKGIRPQDKPMDIGQLNADEQTIIKRRYPELIHGDPKRIRGEYPRGQVPKCGAPMIERN